MTQRVPMPGRSPRGASSVFIIFGGWILFAVALAIAPPAAATVTSVFPSPAEPTTCDTVTLTVTGSISGPCYEIVGAKITGPEPIPCMGPGPCPSLFRIEITVREPNPYLGAPCPLVITPYLRSFDVGRLAPGAYGVTAIERVVPFAAESVGTTLDSSFVSTRFAVRSDSTCQTGEGCYILDFVPDIPPPDASIASVLCTATTAPGGTACLDLALLNSVPVGGLQTTVAVAYNRGAVSPAGLIHAISVEPTGRARGFQVGWSTDGTHTKLILYSPAGALIEPGRGPVVRICYAVPPETTPGVYPVNSFDEIVADATGVAIVQCPTFVPIPGGTICVASPACDVNGDGVSDILDVIRIVRCALAASRDSAACPDSVAARADCNSDGSLDVRDVICCVRKILNFPRGSEPIRGEAPTGIPAAEIGFTGPVRWINEVEGYVMVEIKPNEDWGGAQFSLDPAASPVRIRGVRLLEDPAPDQLEWADDGTGVAHALIYATTTGPRRAGFVRVQVALERMPGVAGGGSLRLVGARSGTLAGAPAPIVAVNASVEISPSIADSPALLAARPNPFLGRTEAGFALPSETRVTLRLYDVAGRFVRTLVDGTMPAGVHRVMWDGADERGRPAPAGIYFARFAAGPVLRSERLLLLR